MQYIPCLPPLYLRNRTTTNCYLFDTVCFATLPARFQSVPRNISSHTLRTALHFTQSINALQPLHMFPDKLLIIGQRYSGSPFWSSKERTVSSMSCLHLSVRLTPRHWMRLSAPQLSNNTPLEKLPSSCLLVLSPQRVCLTGRPQETQKHTWNVTGKSSRCYHVNSSRSYVTRIIFISDDNEILLHNSCEDSLTLRLSHNNFFGPPKQGQTA